MALQFSLDFISPAQLHAVQRMYHTFFLIWANFFYLIPNSFVTLTSSFFLIINSEMALWILFHPSPIKAQPKGFYFTRAQLKLNQREDGKRNEWDGLPWGVSTL
jgi:hypothetical protein